LLQRTWNITAFGDIRGFGSWTSRAAVSREIKDPFIERFYALMDEYVLKYRDVHFKREGDGFMASKKFEFGKDQKNICDFIITLKDLTLSMLKEIKNCPEEFDGIVLRIFDGYVYEIMCVDANDPERKRRVPEYVEYSTNGASHLKEVNPEILCLATKGTVRALGKYGSVFRVRNLEQPSCYPSSLNKVDVEGLKILRF